MDTWWNHLNLIKKTKRGQVNFDAGYKKLRDQYWFRPGAVPNDNKSNLFTTQLYYSSQINKLNNYTIGVQTHRKEIKSNDRGNHSLWHVAIYSIFRHKTGYNLFFNESIRLDWDESYGVVLLPRLILHGHHQNLPSGHRQENHSVMPILRNDTIIIIKHL